MSQNPSLCRTPDYYAARASEERRLSMAAPNEHIRQIHLELAERYDELAKGGADAARPPIVGERPESRAR